MPGSNGCSGVECAFVGLSQPPMISKYLRLSAPSHPQFAQPTVRRLYAEIRELSHFPSRGRPGRETGTRELILTGLPYVIVFRTGDQLIEILRIYHGAQNWK